MSAADINIGGGIWGDAVGVRSSEAGDGRGTLHRTVVEWAERLTR